MAETEKLPLLTMLIIDDYRPYVESLHRDAQRFGIQLLHTASLEEGRERFEGSGGEIICGIILDVKCLKEKGQAVPDNSFLAAALKYFSAKAPHIPLAVLTGESDLVVNLRDLYSGTAKVYSKGRDEREMLGYLVSEARQLDWLKIVYQYQEVFAGLDRHLGPGSVRELASCIGTMGSRDATAIRNNLGCLRRLQEKVYIALHKADNGLIPDRYVEGEVNITAIYKHLTEKGYVERYKVIDRFAEMIYKIGSDNGAHTPYENPKYPPTCYTVQAVTFALLDLLLWFKTMIGQRNN